MGLYGCGALLSNRRGFPEPYIKKELKERGDQLVRQDGQLTAYLWQDNKAVTVIATNANPNEKSSVNRKLRDGSTTPFSCPMAIVLYNQLMGVDTNDQLRGYNNIRTKGRKFYKYVGWLLTDVANPNSYILAREHTHLSFRVQLAKELIGSYRSRKRTGRPSRTPTALPPSTFEHFPVRGADKKKYIVVHTATSRESCVEKQCGIAIHTTNSFATMDVKTTASCQYHKMLK